MGPKRQGRKPSTYRYPISEHIPIEERTQEEVTHIQGVRSAPDVSAAHPAFDITPSRYITAIFTERGVAKPPDTESVRTGVGHSARRRRALDFSLGPACNKPQAACQWPLTRPPGMFWKRRGIRALVRHRNAKTGCSANDSELHFACRICVVIS